MDKFRCVVSLHVLLEHPTRSPPSWPQHRDEGSWLPTKMKATSSRSPAICVWKKLRVVLSWLQRTILTQQYCGHNENRIARKIESKFISINNKCIFVLGQVVTVLTERGWILQDEQDNVAQNMMFGGTSTSSSSRKRRKKDTSTPKSTRSCFEVGFTRWQLPNNCTLLLIMSFMEYVSYLDLLLLVQLLLLFLSLFHFSSWHVSFRWSHVKVRRSITSTRLIRFRKRRHENSNVITSCSIRRSQH